LERHRAAQAERARSATEYLGNDEQRFLMELSIEPMAARLERLPAN
jgi:hypothetical protein